MRTLRFVLLLGAAWCVMGFAHETGHILGGWCCGGTLVAADLLPWHLPYSLFEPDPLPLVTLWSGPILGVLVPVGLAAAIRRPWMWLMANFCLVANGAYLATGWVSPDPFLDTQRLLAHGAHPLSIVLYCVLTLLPGYFWFRRSCLLAIRPPQVVSPTSAGSPVT